MNLLEVSGVTKRNELRSRSFAIPEPSRIERSHGPMLGVPLGMHRMSPEYSAVDPAYVAGNVLLREEPDEEEDDEEEHDGGGEDDDGDEGYSE